LDLYTTVLDSDFRGHFPEVNRWLVSVLRKEEVEKEIGPITFCGSSPVPPLPLEIFTSSPLPSVVSLLKQENRTAKEQKRHLVVKHKPHQEHNTETVAHSFEEASAELSQIESAETQKTEETTPDVIESEPTKESTTEEPSQSAGGDGHVVPEENAEGETNQDKEASNPAEAPSEAKPETEQKSESPQEEKLEDAKETEVTKEKEETEDKEENEETEDKEDKEEKEEESTAGTEHPQEPTENEEKVESQATKDPTEEKETTEETADQTSEFTEEANEAIEEKNEQPIEAVTPAEEPTTPEEGQ
jgi:hypothetical protein